MAFNFKLAEGILVVVWLINAVVSLLRPVLGPVIEPWLQRVTSMLNATPVTEVEGTLMEVSHAKAEVQGQLNLVQEATNERVSPEEVIKWVEEMGDVERDLTGDMEDLRSSTSFFKCFHRMKIRARATINTQQARKLLNEKITQLQKLQLASNVFLMGRTNLEFVVLDVPEM